VERRRGRRRRGRRRRRRRRGRGKWIIGRRLVAGSW